MYALVTYFLFVQNLHCIVLVCSTVLHQHHASEGASAQSFNSVKVIESRCALKETIKQAGFRLNTSQNKVTVTESHACGGCKPAEL